tara:strand:+ start:234 stop:698 length:465 start_codon:yes stop_codon:yes gene_type:complete
MEFLLFLSTSEKEILELIQKAEYRVEENTPLCLLGKNYFGFFKKKQKRIVVCTDNAKIKGGNFFRKVSNERIYSKTGIYIRRAVRHESVHVAQDCNNGELIKLDKTSNIKINPYKLKALKASSKISGNTKSEYQAYQLEDKPKLIISALKKYCL